ncbi:hypothetical protein QCA50_003205 [Cerrena zonata]|uniref:Voltage-gated hydrogen channel 1 n=1 Tax=Cerrena zonata TaxID=2478898 RepID=A0AAW0GJR0_9APHY
MSEQDPLLPSQAEYNDVDVENNSDDTQKHGWRFRMAEFLESKPMHYTVLALVVIDSGCVLADLAYTVLSDSCTSPEGPGAPLWLNVLSHISLAITILFLIEIPLTLWSIGWEHYSPFGDTPHGGLHLFDAFIIVTTFVLEIILRGKERELASLLIILRLWRLVKLVGGIAVGAGDLGEENVKALIETKQELESTTRALTEAQDENQRLRARIAWLETEGNGSGPSV